MYFSSLNLDRSVNVNYEFPYYRVLIAVLLCEKIEV